MSAKLREKYRARAADFLEADEQVEWAVDGRPGTFGNYVLNSARLFPVTRQILLTDRNVYVFALKGGKPKEVLLRHDRSGARASYKKFPPTLTVDDQSVTPNMWSAGRCAGVVRSLETTTATAAGAAPTA